MLRAVLDADDGAIAGCSLDVGPCRYTGEPVLDDEPFEVTRANAGM